MLLRNDGRAPAARRRAARRGGRPQRRPRGDPGRRAAPASRPPTWRRSPTGCASGSATAVVVEPGPERQPRHAGARGRRPPARRRHRRASTSRSSAPTATVRATLRPRDFRVLFLDDPGDDAADRRLVGAGHRRPSRRGRPGAHRFKVKTNGEATLTVDGAPVGDTVDLTAGVPVQLELVAAPRRPAPAAGRRAALRAARARRRLRAGGGRGARRRRRRGRGRPRRRLGDRGARPRRRSPCPGRQVELIEAVAAAQPRTVVVVLAGLAGRPVVGRRRCPRCCGAGSPGQEGGRALADVLFGDAEPGGRLPCTLPAPARGHARRSSTPSPGVLRYQEGVFTGHRWYDARRIEPAFPFGFGLGYTTWAVGHPGGAGAARPGRGRRGARCASPTPGDRRGPRRRAALRRRPRRLRRRAPVRRAARLREGHARPRRVARSSRFALGMRDLARWDAGAERVGGRGRGAPRVGGHVVAATSASRRRSCSPSGGRAPAVGRSGHASVASSRCTRSSGSATSPGRPAPTRPCSCARRPRRCRPSAAIPSGLVAACRRIVDRHPTSAPLWWLCARVLTSPDGQREAWDAVDEIEGDRTAAELAFALPEDATVCVIGWPELVGEALPPRGDVEVLAVDSLGEGSGLVRRLRARRASTPSTCRPRASARRCARPTCCSSRRWPWARPASSAVSGSLAAATVARHAEVPCGSRPAWAGCSRLGCGTRSPAAGRTRAADPWDLDEEVVPLTLVDQVVRARRPRARVEDALRRTDCPVAPELFDARQRPRHLPAVG